MKQDGRFTGKKKFWIYVITLAYIVYIRVNKLLYLYEYFGTYIVKSFLLSSKLLNTCRRGKHEIIMKSSARDNDFFGKFAFT